MVCIDLLDVDQTSNVFVDEGTGHREPITGDLG